MKLQIKYNFTDLDKALAIARQTAQFADIVEVGTLLLFKEGVAAVTAFKKNFPDKQLYVDAKIADRSKESVELFAQAGASFISVLSNTYYYMIQEAAQTAKKYNAQIVLDFISTEMPGQAAAQAKNLGASAILLHRARTPDQSIDLEQDWASVRDNTDLPIFIKGKIDAEVLRDIVPLNPHGVVIGSAITYAHNPAEQAERISKLLKQR
ncbi:orotidine 5'-phosphate decarboxylase [Candidatus Babeliales bacterium]|nr:orotidine 5'-phosphate decarboxylase [Candidatus Babeliales bacterium]